MLPLGIKQAIAQVEVFAGGAGQPSSRGTGFLVAPGLLLTAGHVIQVANRSKIQLRFEGLAPIEATRHACTDGALADWAVLECTLPAAGAPAPIRLERLLLHPYEVRWESFGWPKLYKQLGGSLRGEIRLAADGEIDSAARELEGQAADAADGLSGAPCVVQGAAIGLVETSLGADGKILAGTLKIVPAQRIVAESQGTLLLSDDTPLPYQDFFQTSLRRLPVEALEGAARLLDIDGADTFATLDEMTAARRLARGMIMSGVPATIEVVRALDTALDDKVAFRLLELAETLWIDGAAAARVAALASKAAPRACAVNARLQETGLDYVHRASFVHQGALFPTWPARCFVVRPSKQEPLAASLLLDVLHEVKTAFNLASDDEVKKRMRSNGPFTALIVDSTPSPEAIALLAKELPALQVLFLSHPSRREELERLIPGVEYVEPELTEVDEQLAREARAGAVFERKQRGK